MQADRDDAPRHWRSPNRGRRLLSLTLLGCVATVTAVYLSNQFSALARPATSSTPAPSTAPAAQPVSPAQPRPVAPPALKPVAPAAAAPIAAYRPPAPAGRQTEFNEHNYRPREIVNRLPPAAVAERRHLPRAQTLTRSAPWSWKSRQAIERGTFQWRESAGRIDYASVCQNERRGSLRYRDCRKGAKVAFARLCHERRDPAACHAENNYSALR